MGSGHPLLQHLLEDRKRPLGQDRDDHTVGIYLHIPFCEKKCFYCDFYSLENHSQRADFLECIPEEIRRFAETHPGRLRADTIFFGGGTPSLLTPPELGTILSSIHRYFDVVDGAEVTLECNPGTVTPEKLGAYRSLGVNRLSFGIQSFHDDELKFLSRIHNSREAVEAVQSARRAGFDNINIDLMYALPNQDESRLVSNLDRALELGTTHVSAYGLIVEPGTPLFAAVANGTIVPVPDEIESRMYELVMQRLEAGGFRHYEVSNYSLPGYECRHNLKYWNVEEYVGFGPSAHSYLDNRRWWNVSSLAKYVEEMKGCGSAVSADETLNLSQRTDEYVLLQLRQGRLDPEGLRSRFGMTLDAEFVSDLVRSGRAKISDGTVVLTSAGFTVCDEIAEDVLAHHLVLE